MKKIDKEEIHKVWEPLMNLEDKKLEDYPRVEIEENYVLPLVKRVVDKINSKLNKNV
jgi:hypothetical protein